MSEVHSFEKQTVEKFFDEEAEEVFRQSFAGGVLTIWRNVHSLPFRRACTFTSEDGGAGVPNSNDENLFALLVRAVASGAGAQQLSEVLPLISPTPRKLVVKL